MILHVQSNYTEGTGGDSILKPQIILYLNSRTKVFLERHIFVVQFSRKGWLSAQSFWPWTVLEGLDCTWEKRKCPCLGFSESYHWIHIAAVVFPDVLNVVPAKDRQKPCTVELMFTLPPNSVTKLSIQFQRGFLKWTEHPPDAHHGFYIKYVHILFVFW